MTNKASLFFICALFLWLFLLSGCGNSGSISTQSFTTPEDTISTPSPNPHADDFVTIKDGNFYLKGKEWFPYGANYWPVYGVNPPSESGFTGPDPDYWLGSAYYRPEVIELDCEKMRSLGFTCVATQASLNPDTWPALKDFLARCLANNIRVILSFYQVNPFRIPYENTCNENSLDPIFSALDLAHNPAIFAYDIAWEPVLGTWSQEFSDVGFRASYDGIWSRFIEKEFGTVNRANQFFGEMVAQKRAGKASGIVSHTIPMRTVAGQRYPCEVVMKNLGEDEWTRTGDQLVTIFGEGVPARISLLENVPSGKEIALKFEYVAPSIPGRISLRLSMAHKGTGGFGTLVEWETEVVQSGTAVQKTIIYPTPVLGAADGELHINSPDSHLVNAYRRCLDTEVATRFARVVRHIRMLDPGHLITIRQGYDGNGNPSASMVYPLELYSTAYHLDFLSTENYYFKGTLDNNSILGAMTMIQSYCRWATAGKPSMWIEAAYEEMSDPTPEILREQAKYFDLFIDDLVATGGNGVTFWWWPGGTRADKNKDFGITNPDGTFRPVAFTMRQKAIKATSPRHDLEADTPGIVDLMLSPSGFAGIFAELRPSALQTALKKKMYVLKGDGDGTTSDQDPSISGGLPRHLWAVISHVELKAGEEGDWFEVHDGMSYAVPGDKEIFVRALVENMGDTAWMPKDQVARGGVVFENNDNSGIIVKYDIPTAVQRMNQVSVPAIRITDRLDAGKTLQFQMNAEGVSLITGAIRIQLFPY